MSQQQRPKFSFTTVNVMSVEGNGQAPIIKQNEEQQEPPKLDLASITSVPNNVQGRSPSTLGMSPRFVMIDKKT